MARLKSRNHFPPHGWKFYQPQTRWELPGNLSFNMAVLEIINHRAKNVGLFKQYRLPVDYDSVADELDSFNAIRCINAGHLHFVADCSVDPQPQTDEQSWIADKAFSVKDGKLITVILPFCKKDFALMLKQVSWMAELGGARDHNAIVAFDHSTSSSDAARIAEVGKMAFRSVSVYHYRQPKNTHHLIASKHAFSHVADFMETQIQTPWLWWEADMTALKPGFMNTIQQSYERSGKPFWGPVVPNMGHMNGTSVYPFNTSSSCPSLKVDNNDAFDTGMRGEMAGKMADANPIIYHVWCVRAGRLQPHGDGTVPANINSQLFSQVPEKAVAFHRCKDDSIIRLLRSRK